MKRKQLLILLALLITAATGAWAQDAEDLNVYSNELNTWDLYKSMTKIDANGDGTDTNGKWVLQDNATYMYSPDHAADDWLVTPGLVLKAGVTYTIALEAWKPTPESHTYTETFEVKAATAAATAVTAEDLSAGTQVIKTTEVTTSWMTYRGTFTPTQDGTYYVGIHATSPVDQSSFSIQNLSVDINYYTLSLADDTKDAGNWTATVNGGLSNQLPVGRLNKGDAVTLTYSGHLKVKSVTADAANPNAYLKWDDTKKKLVEAEIPATFATVKNFDGVVEWEEGTYLVEGNVTINGGVTLTGDVELIIKDGAKLTANSIYGNNNYSLNIYGQANKSGELNVACSNSDAIKIFNLLNIHSCKVNASSSKNNCGGFYKIGELNVYGGSVDAKYTGDEKGYGLADIPSLNIWDGEMKAEGKGNGDYSYGITIFGGATNVTVYGGKLWVKSADSKALDPDDDVTFTKDPSYDGVIETSDDGTEWTPYTDAGKPNTKYVRVGY